MEGAKGEGVRGTEKKKKSDMESIEGNMMNKNFQLYPTWIGCFRKVNIKRKILKSVKLERNTLFSGNTFFCLY